MKNRHFDHLIFFQLLCLIVIIFSASCRKGNSSASENESICVSRLSPQASDYTVSGADLDSIYALFRANNLSTSNLQFLIWQTDTTTNIYINQYSGYQEQVTGTPFFNGLPLFGENEAFIFDAGKLPPGGILGGYQGPAPSVDTSGHQPFSALRKAFLAHVPESYTEGGANDAKPFIPSASTYTNSCLNVTLEYIDAGAIPGNAAAYGTALVKVWSVTPSISSSITYYPLVFVEDDNGHAWGVAFIYP